MSTLRLRYWVGGFAAAAAFHGVLLASIFTQPESPLSSGDVIHMHVAVARSATDHGKTQPDAATDTASTITQASMPSPPVAQSDMRDAIVQDVQDVGVAQTASPNAGLESSERQSAPKVEAANTPVVDEAPVVPDPVAQAPAVVEESSVRDTPVVTPTTTPDTPVDSDVDPVPDVAPPAVTDSLDDDIETAAETAAVTTAEMEVEPDVDVDTTVAENRVAFVAPRNASPAAMTETQAVPAPVNVPAPVTAPANRVTAAITPAVDLGSLRTSHDDRIGAHLYASKRYPRVARKRGQQGISTVRFTIDRSGKLLSSELLEPSGHRSLDRESLALLERAAPFPAIPSALPESTRTLEVPVVYTLN